MGVRSGYKNTEVGIIPNDWDVKTYGDVFDFLATATYSRAELTEIDTVKYVHYGDIHTTWNFFLDVNNSNLPTVRAEQVKNYHLIKDGDVIMADASEDYSGIGKSVEVKNLGTIKAISGLHTFLFRDKNEVFVSGFRGYIHFNKVVKTQFDRLATGLKVYGVSKGNLKTVKIPVPTKAEQIAIATALSDADALINSLEKIIAKKRNIKQGAIQKLLKPKKGWEVKKLGEVADVLDNLRKPLNDSARQQMKGDIPYCGANGIVDFVDDFVIDDDIILIAEDGGHFNEYKTRPIAYQMKGKCWVNNHAHILKAKKEIDQIFLFYSLVNKNILDFINGGTRAKLNKGELVNILVALSPLKEEQTRIATILSDMDAEITALETKLEKYRKIKLGMMQNLLTGKIRLV
jgi:type I restriction enzyme S subunit